MIFRLLTNANYLIYFFCIFVILMLLTYLIYKLFIIEHDLFIVNEKINKIELEFFNNNPNLSFENETNKENFNLSDIIMNEVFNANANTNANTNPSSANTCSTGTCNVNTKNKVKDNKTETFDSHSIDIDTFMNDEEIIKPNDNTYEEQVYEKRVVFDLKKEIIVDDKESIVSENNFTKKKLQKLNLDKLKEKCVEYNLSTEGTKAQLVDKIFEEINKET